ncbi:hypothetical protein RKE29_09395 [Streptomyces sp. B1866]|uniref:MutS-related protein n=1 Tax=Streptomyces sp. B1866 TaxID=3075431 RepID=UPI0028916BD8|nr:hypothetical protein [Streptomyces sp. B1866]MDT3396855.1 hypothetical protein [Streptomyces sp. B1866]
MTLRSILSGSRDRPGPPPETAAPDHFADLNLDQIAAAVTRAGGCPASYLHRPLRDEHAVRFRQEVFRDLEDPRVRQEAERFTTAVAHTRRRLDRVGQLRHPPQAHRRLLEILLDHADAVTAFAAGLAQAPVASPGLLALRDDLAAYVRRPDFHQPCDQARRLRDRLAAVRFDLLLRDGKVTVARPDPEARPDYAERVLALFERFRHGPPADPRPGPAADPGLDQVEAGVLDLVVQLCPGLFAEVAAFCDGHRDLVSDEIARLDRELRFYLGYLAYLAPVRAAGLPVCYPAVSATDKAFLGRQVYDLALAAELAARGGRVVPNDVHLSGAERILVVSGPNQGGKTTLSRTFGQLHHLAALGCPVPGREVRVFLADRILTHYERAEDPGDLVSKLEDELLRMRAILQRATPDSVVILNEVFTSTTTADARTLSRAVLAEITRLDALCLWVSFLDELSRYNDKTVSMVSTVAADDGATRTYRVLRRPADGRAYARALARRHGLTYPQLVDRMRR